MNANTFITTGKTYKICGVVIEEVKTEPCYRLVQYGKGLPIVCACSVCKSKNQTPEEAKSILDRIYK